MAEHLGSTPGLSPARDLATRWTWARACLDDEKTTVKLSRLQSLAKGAYIGWVDPEFLKMLRPWVFDNLTYASVCHDQGIPPNASPDSLFVYPLPPYEWYVLRRALSLHVGGHGAFLPSRDYYAQMVESARRFREHLHRIGSDSGKDMHGRPNMHETVAEFGDWLYCAECHTTKKVQMYRERNVITSKGGEFTMPYCDKHARQRGSLILGAA